MPRTGRGSARRKRRKTEDIPQGVLMLDRLDRPEAIRQAKEVVNGSFEFPSRSRSKPLVKGEAEDGDIVDIRYS